MRKRKENYILDPVFQAVMVERRTRLIGEVSRSLKQMKDCAKQSSARICVTIVEHRFEAINMRF